MQNQIILLRDGWELTYFDGYGQFVTDFSLPEVLTHLPWIPARVPGSVYADLARAEWIADVHQGCNSLAAQWVEHQYWFYRHRFDGTALLQAARNGVRCLLHLDGLDGIAVVYVNGHVVARHSNAFRPLSVDITERLRAGQNELIIRLESGLIEGADRRHGDYHLEVSAFTTKRALLRRPQFLSRWDWAPRLFGVGIGAPACLHMCDSVWLDHVVITPELDHDLRRARLRVRCHVRNVTALPQFVGIRACVHGADTSAQQAATIAPGPGVLETVLTIQNPTLWWPRPLGAPALYSVEVVLVTSDTEKQRCTRLVGIRSVSLNQEPISDGGRRFQIVINGSPVFCKGANWVPVDVLYSAVQDADYTNLLALAVECGCNLLRIWGGGHYAHSRFMEACDKEGIMVWHDLMFACSKYPGDNPAFVAEVDAEVRHQIRRLASHPSLVLWCGNNENTLGVQDGWISSYDPRKRPCDDLFLRQIPDIVAAEDGSRPYWPTSPWSPDGSHPNHPLIGDQHPWLVSLGPAKGDFWQYRADMSRFPNEGGMLGASTPKTLHEILPPAERRVGSRTWLHHDNTQNTWRGEALLDHLLRLNLCSRPQGLSFAEYAQYSAILQGEALQTAIDNWRRRKFDTSGAVFWMFHDCWPATTSWAVVDYYRRRKPAFWYVKRAFAHLRAICVEVGNEVVVYVVNDYPTERRATLRYGLFALAGGRPLDESMTVLCPPDAALPVVRWPLALWDQAGRATHGAFALLSAEDGTVSTHRLFRERFRDLSWVEPRIRLSREATRLRLCSEQFAWAVCLDADGEWPLEDNYFDLLPGIAYVVPWPAERPTPRSVRAANPWGITASNTHD